MFSTLNGELARPLQADRIAQARYQALVREARSTRTSRPRHLLASALLAVARRMEPIGARAGISLGREPASIRPELPCAVRPC